MDAARPSPTPLPPSRFLARIVGMTVLIVLVVCLLPHDRFLRFFSLTEPAVVKSAWIYQRIHNDTTPLDVVFIGTSRSVFGLDSAQIEAAQNRAGGSPLHMANFAIEHLGRDVHYFLAREALENRSVKLLVVEVAESEPRDLHPAFAALADPADLLAAPLLINPSYAGNLARLPLRQVKLFAHTLVPTAFGLRTGFAPEHYRGAHWDDAYAATGSDEFPIRPVIARLQTHDAAELEVQRQHYARLIGAKLSLPPPLRFLEYRANLRYVDAIAELARRRGVAIRFLYLPQYAGAEKPEFAVTYQQYAPVWSPGGVIAASRLWLDINHLNYAGASALAPWLADQIAALRLP